MVYITLNQKHDQSLTTMEEGIIETTIQDYQFIQKYKSIYYAFPSQLKLLGKK